MNRPTRIHSLSWITWTGSQPFSWGSSHRNKVTLLPLLKCYTSSRIQFVFSTWWTVPSISTGTMKSALLMGWEEKTKHKRHISVTQSDGVVTQLTSRGPTSTTHTTQSTEWQSWEGKRKSVSFPPKQIPPPCPPSLLNLSSNLTHQTTRWQSSGRNWTERADDEVG